MSGEWQPGDVALAFNDDIEFRVVRHAGGDGPDYWSAANGTYPMSDAARSEHLNYRPLVAIDPEDREQVERLWKLNRLELNRHPVDTLQAALREFATPTPPKCGAVLSLAGMSYRCELDRGHEDPHSNDAARALWGERR